MCRERHAGWPRSGRSRHFGHKRSSRCADPLSRRHDALCTSVFPALPGVPTLPVLVVSRPSCDEPLCMMIGSSPNMVYAVHGTWSRPVRSAPHSAPHSALSTTATTRWALSGCVYGAERSIPIAHIRQRLTPTLGALSVRCPPTLCDRNRNFADQRPARRACSSDATAALI